MNEQPTYTSPVEPQKANKKTSKALKVFGIVILAIIALAGVGYSVYAWQQTASLRSDLTQKESDNKSLVSENTSLRASIGDMNHEPVVSDQDSAQKAAQNYIDAQVLDTKYVAVVNSVKGNFAAAGAAPSSNPSHVVVGLLLKKVNESWVVIYSGQNGPDQDTVTKFAIPEEYRQ